MSHFNPVLTRSTLLDRVVFNAQTDEEVGQINQVWVDWNRHQVVGFTCSRGFWGQSQRSFRWSQIEAIGLSALYVSFQQPNPNLFEISKTIDFRIGHSLHTHASHFMGRLTDYDVDQDSGIITRYRFSFSGTPSLAHKSHSANYSLPPRAIGQVTEKQMMLRPDVGQTLPAIPMAQAIAAT